MDVVRVGKVSKWVLGFPVSELKYILYGPGECPQENLHEATSVPLANTLRRR